MKYLSALVAVLTVTATSHADITAAVNAALESDVRSEAERGRDANRRPLETLQFFGLEADMTVLELVPGGGWYTKVLAPVLAADGNLVLALGAGRAGEMAKGLGWDVEVINSGTFVPPAAGSRQAGIADLSLGEGRFDMVLTFRNLHNFNEEGRRAMNVAAFESLKSGGIYGVVDHTRRHMQAQTAENWRRMDPVLAIKEIEAAGFEFVDYTNLHYRADDELRYEVGRKSVTGNTDRFTLKFRKP